MAVEQSIHHNSAGIPNRACVAATAAIHHTPAGAQPNMHGAGPSAFPARTAQSCILCGAAVAHTSLHGVRRLLRAHCWLNGASNATSCLLQTRHLTVNMHGDQFCRHE
ncbi:hypothetical protein TRVL_10127 [Trypanosoma vivax]|nr:hypothetical protein TRVL_10127 [Trypanosoma vivax]